MANRAARAREYAARREARAGLAALRERQPADLLTVVQAAERLSVSDDTIRALVHAGKLSHVRVGIGGKKARIRFTEADLEAYIDRNRRVAPADAERSKEIVRVPRRRSLAATPEAGRYA